MTLWGIPESFFSFTAGNLATLAVLVAALWRLDSFIRLILIEHELLIEDYCERRGLKAADLVTRRRGIWRL